MEDSKIKPLFKKGIKTEAKNYRTLSLLPLISKVIEKSVQDQTKNYRQRNGLLYIYQSGFRAKTYWYDFNRSSKSFQHLRSIY